ncbi:hypothetical protein L2E82_00813 [Cichorium intybus]|uniref:Uncharacterized protein n=1 Tax=Cichorium intybus TaxID=13427 RepID=A0ACB9GYH9_CICIN|nr:hypothetical protein L2E82_00813 [Cichorium intybus]
MSEPACFFLGCFFPIAHRSGAALPGAALPGVLFPMLKLYYQFGMVTEPLFSNLSPIPVKYAILHFRISNNFLSHSAASMSNRKPQREINNINMKSTDGLL